MHRHDTRPHVRLPSSLPVMSAYTYITFYDIYGYI